MELAIELLSEALHTVCGAVRRKGYRQEQRLRFQAHAVPCVSPVNNAYDYQRGANQPDRFLHAGCLPVVWLTTYGHSGRVAAQTPPSNNCACVSGVVLSLVLLLLEWLVMRFAQKADIRLDWDPLSDHRAGRRLWK